jgi:hypothetical protein
MARKETGFYNARALDGSHKLDIEFYRGGHPEPNGDTFVGNPDTLEGVKQIIDYCNRQKAVLCFPPSSWIITYVEVYEWFTDEGRFEKRETYEGIVETYPQKEGDVE